MLTTDQVDRAEGVLLGTAAGDALGAGYEFGYPTADQEIAMIGGGPFDWAPGEWTDDTSMAMCVADALAAESDALATGSVGALNAVAANFVTWYDTRPPDIGNQTRSVLSHRDSSADAMTRRAAGLSGRTGGNGSLMRTAPVALAFLHDERGLVDAATSISALTHSDPQAGEACALWSVAIRHAVLHGTYDGLRLALSADPALSHTWSPLLDAAEAGTPADFANNGWVVHALQTAWWAIATTEEDERQLPRALEKCVRAGGDTDTTAAIAGGLLGARWGRSAIPPEWIDVLHGYPGRRAADLISLTHTLTDGAS
ncbi:ADP-ribosylglycohydrolase family protein [Rhodococcoides corynebacterioides]|uniref:ADP-ribosylglycohydrolase family protein n=1 Tax=Rhodococcoides corynebacterioides TaxID=53972 RepID=UPI001C9A48D9|nr:ADP-ribosylglycohydrolase family protein [Rhodococcus corynebacterioides]MBY6350450.1 ADP-ribosylglycohydrolase family protein [Rhodococcus corynebacterioides]